MADTLRLTDGADTIDFSPVQGYIEPGEFDVYRHSAVSGKEYSYKFYKKGRYEIPVDFMTVADVALISGWWENLVQLSYYPDYINNPATIKTVRIHNESDPLTSFHAGSWKDKLYGTIILREI